MATHPLDRLPKLLDSLNDLAMRQPVLVEKVLQDIGPSPMAELADTAVNAAGVVFEQVMAQVKNFNETIGDGYNVGVILPGVSQAFLPGTITHYNPSVLVFTGELADGSPARAVLHVSQLNLVLVAVPKASPEEPKRYIGFGRDRPPEPSPS